MVINRKILQINVIMVAIIVPLLLAIYVNSNKKVDIKCDITAEDAIGIGKIICERVYPQFDYVQYEWKSIYIEEKLLWIVFCKDNESTLGGGLPEIHIKKNNAEVVFIGLAA